MRKIRTPFFEIGTKNYIYGDDVLNLAIAADKMAENMILTFYLQRLTQILEGLLKTLRT